MSNIERLKNISSLSELALLLGYKPRALSFILYKINDNDKYTHFNINKKNGGVREIKAPIDKLKTLQKRLAKLLTDCDIEIAKTLNHKHTLSHGFKLDHSIVTNAEIHKNRRHVFNVDLKDFFPSINFGRVRGFFIKNSHFSLNPNIATIIAQIACHDHSLPQGSPCSPIISNLIGHLLDIRIVNLAKNTKCTYSRYVDDLTFSTNKKIFPEEIAKIKPGSDNIWKAGKTLKKEIKKVGFKINKKKTSMQSKTNRQLVTGLVVNKKINVKREYYKRARSMCYTLFKTDEFYLDDEKSIKGNLNQLEGILSYIYQIKFPFEKDIKLGTRHYKPTAITKLYRDFLFYKHFFSLKQPIIVCEGKTDIIYLRTALTQLSKHYNTLIKIEGGKYVFNINFLRRSDNINNAFAIAEGTSGLAFLLEMYSKHMARFEGDGKNHPVIMLVDNDDGSDEIIKKLGGKYKKGDSIVHVTDNLYVVFVPYRKGKLTAIEDLFDAKTLAEKVDGKIFNRSGKNMDHKKEYSKTVFAKKVVKAKKEQINFDEFKKIFDSFIKVMATYKKIP